MIAQCWACWFAWIHSPPEKNHVAYDQAHSGCMGVVTHDRSVQAGFVSYGCNVDQKH